MNDIQPGNVGVFLWDRAWPPTFWEYQGENATGQHVFSAGTVTDGNFKVLHSEKKEFWALA